MQEANQKAKTEYEAKLQEQSYNFALESALSDAGVRNAKAVKALLDIEKIKLNSDKLSGLKEQLEALKISDGYLFNRPKKVNPPFQQRRNLVAKELQERASWLLRMLQLVLK